MSRFGTPAQASAGRPAPLGSANQRNQNASGLIPHPHQQQKESRHVGLERLHRLLQQEGSVHGGLYLDPGPSNRLVLSLRSGLAADVEFALERLLLTVSIESDLLALKDFPSLLDALSTVISRVASFPSANGRPAAKEFSIQHQQTNVRQATEAALILRFIAFNSANTAFLQASRHLKSAITSVLEVFNDSAQADCLVEMVGMLLDILDIIAPTFDLTAPLSADLNTAEDPAAVDPHPNSVASALFALCHSTDRALTLGAFRCLAMLAGSPDVIEKNEPVFTFACSKPGSKGAKLIDRALELLSLPDPDLTSAVLDFLYAYTLITSNADSMCGRSDMKHIARLLITKLSVGGTRDDFDGEPLTKIAERTRAQNILQTELAKFQQIPNRLPLAELQLLLGLPDHQRSVTWIKWVFEDLPEGEFTQVNLWSAYRDQFDAAYISAITGLPPAPIMPAADVIKHSSEAYSSALPQVVEFPEKRFIIRGIKLRDRNELADSFRRLWTEPENPNDPYSRAPDGMLSPGVTPAADILVAGLQMLIQNQAPLPQGMLSKKFAQFRAFKQNSNFLIHFSRWSTSSEGSNNAALLAATTLRNLGRAVKATCRPVERSHDFSGPNLLDVLAGHSDVTAESNKSAQGGVGEAARATNVFLDIEQDILDIAIGNRMLSPQLGEIMQAIAEIRQDRQKGKVRARALFAE